MSTTCKQFVLNAKGCSGRGVRLRILDPVARATVRTQSAKMLTDDSTRADWEARENVTGIIATVLQVTKKTGLSRAEDLIKLGTEAWESPDAEELEKRLAEFFNAKDLDALSKMFRSLHDVTEKEVENILGEAQDVTVD